MCSSDLAKSSAAPNPYGNAFANLAHPKNLSNLFTNGITQSPIFSMLSPTLVVNQQESHIMWVEVDSEG